jgi:hypothetical protein
MNELIPMDEPTQYENQVEFIIFNFAPVHDIRFC